MSGTITEIRPCYNNGCPRLSAHILCQDNKLKEKECDEHRDRKRGRDCRRRRNRGKLAGECRGEKSFSKVQKKIEPLRIKMSWDQQKMRVILA